MVWEVKLIISVVFAVPEDNHGDRWICPCPVLNASIDDDKMLPVEMPYLPSLGLLTAPRGRKGLPFKETPDTMSTCSDGEKSERPLCRSLLCGREERMRTVCAMGG